MKEKKTNELYCMGRVSGSSGAAYMVTADDGRVFRCRSFPGTESGNPDASLVAVGDLVQVQGIQTGTEALEGNIMRVEPRTSALVRKRDPRRNRSREKQQVIASNIELLVPVVSAYEPPLSTRLIDRYLVFAESEQLPILIVVNKIELDKGGRTREQMAVYHELGYQVCYVSVHEKTGIDELAEVLAGKISAFSGHSGVGKSSLINLMTGCDLKTSATSFKTRKGVHTTSNATMHSLPGGGFVIDTPGIREFSLADITRENLRFYFREFLSLMPECGFSSCTHTVEPHCAVRRAAEQEMIDAGRYESYLLLFDALDEGDRV
ncbi:MAG: ribosome small subunit-dependent GTPase A [Chlorobium sp.]|uniref:ribosome small subunit-dependent GTPase A n=2 Tax=Chlorobium sp. TaxID=1095 RepID=UPI0025C6D918|nr:ribosome small subunit-dependent GTPase A [Chlorobium sp.]MCF8216815.1 ribosome small subunit-dependent GTPase A [Chlorobium sp.]MCF8271660.1 ribosome small subunit-dependent GTPase A [Chlorobium sp.]MCF8288032.1 ribosome small subunit-dependent GTPase A [Chlorobium sp.]MCF8291616.1 ribosome small subunit-dependent GTPase A [Chlorobium sp.]MCF8385750.1 ribosome small subunit-dependent GTPase A [Chlorobium sp.]